MLLLSTRSRVTYIKLNWKLIPLCNSNDISFFFPMALRPNAGHDLLIIEVSRSHTTAHHSRWDSSGRMINSSQRPLPDSTQHSQHTNIHAPGGIRTHDLSRRAAADLRLRPRGHWERHWNKLVETEMLLHTKYKSAGYHYLGVWWGR